MRTLGVKAPSEIVHACFSAYETKDLEALLPLLSPEFTFTSPLDDAISREAYLERCWPNSQHLRKFTFLRLFERGDEVFVTYEAERADGVKFRNTEFFQTENGQITHVDVYFGPDNIK